MNHEDESLDISFDRRALLRASSLGALGLIGASLLGKTRAQAASKPAKYNQIHTLGLLNLPGLKAGDDVRVLNYALTLEDLEADLYEQALQRLTTGGQNKLGTMIPGLGLTMAEPDVHYMAEFAPVEAEHRDFLRRSLDSLISGLATRSYKYDFGIESKSRQEVLDLVLTVEGVGVRAYLGAVPKLRTRLFITAAAAIQGTEARHTAVLTAVQNELFNGASPKTVAPLAGDNQGRDTPLDPDTVLAMVSAYIVA